MMKKHIINSFKIRNLSKIDFSYKIVSIELDSSIEEDSDKKFKALHKALNTIKSEVECAAALIKKHGKYCIAIPANEELKNQKISFKPFTLILTLNEKIYTARHNSGREEDKEIVLKFLDFRMRHQLGEDYKTELFSEGTHNFFLKEPKLGNYNVEIYEGFSFRLIEGDDGEYYLFLDIQHKYMENKNLSQYVYKNNKEQLIKKLRGKKCLIQNGDNWYPVTIENIGNEIDKEEFESEGTFYALYPYIYNKIKKAEYRIVKWLRKHHLALYYTYPGRDNPIFKSATTLAKLILKTDDHRVASLHKYTILNPYERWKLIDIKIKKYFQKISFGGHPIRVSKIPAKQELNYFPLPALKYNNDLILSIGDYDKFGNPITEDNYPFLRKDYILKNGIISNAKFDTQILVVPKLWDLPQIEGFQVEIEKLLKKLSPKYPGFHKIVTYDYDEYFNSAIEQVREIEKALKEKGATSGFALFILPDHDKRYSSYIKNLHDCLKKKFFPSLKFQCALVSTINQFYQTFTTNNSLLEYRPNPRTIRKFNSYIFNLGLEFFNLNRRWSYALANNLHYDIYIGIDVHGNYIGLSFFFKNGENIYFDFIETSKVKGKKRNEKIFANEIFDKITNKLKHFIKKLNLDPNGILVVRDGRSFDEETNALERVIKKLHKEDFIDGNSIKWGIVDIHKNSALPVRAFLPTDSYQKIENPRAGTYFINERKKIGFIFNTGYPFKIRGSAKNIQVVFRDGNFDYQKVLQDLFDQSILAFSAPNRSNSLPIVLKIIDTFLGHMGASFGGEDVTREKKVLVEKAVQGELFPINKVVHE